MIWSTRKLFLVYKCFRNLNLSMFNKNMLKWRVCTQITISCQCWCSHERIWNNFVDIQWKTIQVRFTMFWWMQEYKSLRQSDEELHSLKEKHLNFTCHSSEAGRADEDQIPTTTTPALMHIIRAVNDHRSSPHNSRCLEWLQYYIGVSFCHGDMWKIEVLRKAGRCTSFLWCSVYHLTGRLCHIWHQSVWHDITIIYEFITNFKSNSKCCNYVYKNIKYYNTVKSHSDKLIWVFYGMLIPVYNKFALCLIFCFPENNVMCSVIVVDFKPFGDFNQIS